MAGPWRGQGRVAGGRGATKQPDGFAEDEMVGPWCGQDMVVEGAVRRDNRGARVKLERRGEAENNQMWRTRRANAWRRLGGGTAQMC